MRSSLSPSPTLSLTLSYIFPTFTSYFTDLMEWFVILQVVAFVAGYLYQDVYVTLWIGLAGTALTAMVVVPPWPIYNTHPEKWLNARGGGIGTTGIVVHGLKVG